MLRSARAHEVPSIAHGGRRLARNLVAGLAVAAVLAGAGCSKHETKDADIITSDSASSDSTPDSVPTFDTAQGYTPTGDSKLDAFCTGLAELDENSIVQNTDLALNLRVVVMLRIIDDAVPHAPAEIAAATTAVRDFLRDASKIDAQQVATADKQFLEVANSSGVAKPLAEFLGFVRAKCGFTLDVDPTSRDR